jgi:hypothetical protein
MARPLEGFAMLVRSVAVAACIVGLFACAGSEPDSAIASNDQAATAAEPSCGASYGKADDLYEQAVALAKQHHVDACSGVDGSDEGAYLSTIAAKASQATSTCGAFANVIKTSPWAAPIRDELKGTLVLPLLTGDLQVKDASGAVVFDGLAAALPGVTLWGPAAGIYGNQKKIELGPNGTAKIWTSHFADPPYWSTTDATYTIGAVHGDAITITIVEGATTTSFELRPVTRDDGAPDFYFQPAGAVDGGDLYTAYISECEA